MKIKLISSRKRKIQKPDSKVLIFPPYSLQAIDCILQVKVQGLFLTIFLAKLARIGNERKIGEYRLYEKSEDYKKLAEGKADDDRIAQAEFEEYDEVLDKLKSSIAYQIKVKLENNFRKFKKIIQLELIATLKDNDDLTEIAEDYENHEGKGSTVT